MVATFHHKSLQVNIFRLIKYKTSSGLLIVEHHGPFCTEFVYPECWRFENGATSKIDDVLIKHGGLLHVLPLAVHLDF